MALQSSDLLLINRGEESYKTTLNDHALWITESPDSPLKLPVPLGGNGISVEEVQGADGYVFPRINVDRTTEIQSGLSFWNERVTPGENVFAHRLYVKVDGHSILINGENELECIKAIDAEICDVARTVITTQATAVRDYKVFFGNETHVGAEVFTDEQLKYNPATDELFATKFNGSFVGDGSQLTNLPFPSIPPQDPTFPTGTKMVFVQSTAPTGWSKVSTHNNKALRVVNGAAGTGGSIGFTNAFTTQTPTGVSITNLNGVSVGNTTLTVAQMPSHDHPGRIRSPYAGSVIARPYTGEFTARSDRGDNPATTRLVAQGGGGAHTHNISGSVTGSLNMNTMDFNVAYVDVIIATAN